eukprot:m.893810 g.893810  ORF g.893810 m.893810 type:complete len:215 (-) comp23663_c0_seq9:2593-3237(-)
MVSVTTCLRNFKKVPLERCVINLVRDHTLTDRRTLSSRVKSTCANIEYSAFTGVHAFQPQKQTSCQCSVPACRSLHTLHFVTRRRNGDASIGGHHAFATQVGGPVASPDAVKVWASDLIRAHPVVMISKSTCGFCSRAKKILEAHTDDVQVVHIDSFQAIDAIQDYMLELTGGRTVPRVFIGQQSIGGASDVAALEAAGKLRKLIDAAKSACTK